ncbi:MAG TPA: BON domain-containing protein [Polyangiaceae bacterium]|nr:BON domain-containing protein [Polyangiaceae bacterium]
MRHFSVLIAGALAACAAHNSAPVASSNSVQAATETPSSGPSFAPASSDGVAAAPADARARTTKRAPQAPATTPDTTNMGAPSRATESDATNGYVYPATGNAAALPTQAPPSATYEADNSRVNVRDRSGTTLTPMDQGKSEADRKLTQQIRQAVVSDSSLSFTAKNVKIITLGGKVTLRGAVKTDQERMTIGATAKKIAGEAQVDNFLEVSR